MAPYSSRMWEIVMRISLALTACILLTGLNAQTAQAASCGADPAAIPGNTCSQFGATVLAFDCAGTVGCFYTTAANPALIWKSLVSSGGNNCASIGYPATVATDGAGNTQCVPLCDAGWMHNNFPNPQEFACQVPAVATAIGQSEQCLDMYGNPAYAVTCTYQGWAF